MPTCFWTKLPLKMKIVQAGRRFDQGQPGLGSLFSSQKFMSPAEVLLALQLEKSKIE
jgi:hypothetical protein